MWTAVSLSLGFQSYLDVDLLSLSDGDLVET
jgi:hypothetical protein